MARHLRRLIYWLSGGVLALVLLALLACAALWWFFDPDDYRAQLESRASAAIGRAVHLTGRLHWQLGERIVITSDGGEIANAAGFGTQPLARWSRIQLGIAARPLLHKRVLIDRIEVDGLQLQLQRDAQGKVNWELQPAAGKGGAATQSVTVRIGAVTLRGSEVRFQDVTAGADWRATSVVAGAKLPDDLTAADLAFHDIEFSGLAAGGPLAHAGVAFAAQAGSLQYSPQQLQVPQFTLHWADATLSGGVTLQRAAEIRPGTAPQVTAALTLQAPALRTLLATVSVTPPPMQDPDTLGKLQLAAALHYAADAVTMDDLSVTLDDAHLTGRASLPRLQPLALRFDLSADRVDLDRYRKPGNVKSEPFELPLAQLKALDVKGVLRIRQATAAGAAAKEVRIDVQ
jgi:AsmA protein